MSAEEGDCSHVDQPLKSGSRAKRRVLVVEDNLDTVHTMAALITIMGHECEFAINGSAALEVAREFRPDVILLDINLPDFKGYEIAKQLKRAPELEPARIIAISVLPVPIANVP